MLGFQECCDAVYYADAGQICWVRGWPSCWFEFRALGSTLLNALMYPYGLAPLSHALLLVFSLFMTDAMQVQSHAGKVWHLKNILNARHANRALYLQKHLLKALGAFLLLEFMFMGLASVNLTDVPAGVFAAFAIVGFYRKNAILFALAAGVSVLIRAAYLYPMLVMVAYFIAESLYKKTWSKAAISTLFFVCLAPQYWLTYQHLGIFSFLDPAKVEYWRNFHFSSNLAGYDTLINPSAPHPWQSGVPLGMAAAFEQHHWGELIKLLASRGDFYFSSFVPVGKVYLTDAGERIFSPLIFILHLAALVASYLYLKVKGSAWRVWIPLSIILAQSFLLIPEQRFIFVPQLFLVLFAYLYFVGNKFSTTLSISTTSTHSHVDPLAGEWKVKLFAIATYQHFTSTLIKSSKDKALNNVEQRIVFLDYLRIFAFVSVVIGHRYYGYLQELQKNNQLHVTPKLALEYLLPFFNGGAGFIVFFIISGYIISHVLTVEQPVSFMIRRVFRIYPLYVVALLLENLTASQFSPLSVLIPQLLLIGDFLNTPYALGGVEWTLRIEMMFYIFMAICKHLGFLDMKRSLMIYVVSATVIILSQLPPFPSGGGAKGCFLIFSPFFFIGLGFWLYEKFQIGIGAISALVLTVLGCHYYLIALYRPAALYEHYAVLGVFVFVLAWYFRAYFQSTSLVTLLSNLTYSVYLFHNWLIPYLLRSFDSVESKLLSNLYSLIILVTVCFVLHKTIERPFNKLGRIVSLKYSVLKRCCDAGK